MKFALPLLAAAALLMGGCGDKDSVPKHTAEEAKAIQEAASLSPEEQIKRIEEGGMPQSAKDAMIAEIKNKHGLK